jgi:hypothetical protein
MEKTIKKSTENAVAEAITASLEKEHGNNESSDVNNFPAAIQEIGEALFERYPEKTTILSSENVLGIIRCKALNEYIQETTGVRYTVLDIIAEETVSRRLSINGKGLQLFIDAIHGINASFQQVAAPLLGNLRR